MAKTAAVRHSWRLRLLIAGFAVGACALTFRLFHLQVIDHDTYRAQAETTHQGYRKVYAPRGTILDRNGHPLAISVETFDVYVDGRGWRTEDIGRSTTTTLAGLLGIPPDQVGAVANSGKPGGQLLARGLTAQAAETIGKQGLAGVRVVQSSRRAYPEGNIASALLGFVGKDPVGLAGIEADYDDLLAGKPGSEMFDRDSMGNDITIGRREVERPKQGTDIVLTIDRTIQAIAETALDDAIRRHQASGGDIIVQDPRTGAILAMVTRPSFDVRRLDLSGDVNLALLRNRTIADQYEPGSVFKLITMAAALDRGVVSPGTTYNDSGMFRVYDSEIKNWDLKAYGTQTMTQVLQRSLNTGSAWVSQVLGPQRFYEYVAAFGFGEPTRVGLSGEATGTYRTPDNKQWSPVDLATNSFGQGISVTPLQLITAISAIANGGNLMRPYVVQEVVGSGKREVTKPKAVRRVISEETSRTMRSMMHDVVDDVPGHRAQVARYNIGGKSGTANIASDSYKLQTIASFVGVAPADNPQFVMLIKIDGPRDDEFGSTVAAPIFGDLAPRILRYLKIAPAESNVLNATASGGAR